MGQRLLHVVGAGLALSALAATAEPARQPILCLDTGMHTAKVWRAASDAAGRWLVTVSADKTARIWELASGRLSSVLRPPIGSGLEGELNAVAMSANGATLAVAGSTGYEWDKAYSIYLFERASAREVRRIGELPSPIEHLAFSPDDRWLAAGFAGANGIRLFDAASGDEVGRDAAYGASSLSVHFRSDGKRLVSTSQDGRVRLYEVGANGDLRKLKELATQGGSRPHAARFSPDGQRIAVGYLDSHTVEVLDAETLELVTRPDVSGIDGGVLGSVAWFSEGRGLAAAGGANHGGRRFVRLWSSAGWRVLRDVPAALNTIQDLVSLPAGRIAFTASDPAWGVVSADSAQPERDIVGSIADFRDAGSVFRVSADGTRVGFGYGQFGHDPAIFDVARSALLEDATGLSPPRTTAPNLKVANWRHHSDPSVNGAAIKLGRNEVSHAVAIDAQGTRFALATECCVRYFDAGGHELWSVASPTIAWAVNLSADGHWIIAGYADGTIRWHRASDGAVQLTLYPHSDRKRWVMVSATGYYAASPGSEELLGWQINRGAEEAADFFPAGRFHDRFYRPELVAKTLESGGEAQTARAAGTDAEPAQEAPPVQTVLPPIVTLQAPLDGASVSTPTLRLRYTVRTPPDAPQRDLRVRVNGQMVASSSPAETPARDSQELEVPIPPQDSEIALFAANRNGWSSPATAHVVWKGKPQEAPAKPRLYVLAVGVSDYENADYRLDLAAKDARDFADAMQRQGGGLYRAVEVRLLTDRKATRSEIEDGLDWLERQVGAKDVGMLFLSGHGINAADGTYYFAPANFDLDRIKSSGLVFSEIKNTLSALAGKALFFVDSCHAGNVLGQRAIFDMTGVINDLISAENGVVVFSASTGREVAQERREWGNGAFTKALLEGLAGKADPRHSGRITHKMLDVYVADRVKELTRGEQHPVTQAPGGVPDFPIALVR